MAARGARGGGGQPADYRFLGQSTRVRPLAKGVCPEDTFAMLRKEWVNIIDNAAVAFSIAPVTESPIEVFFGTEAVKFLRGRYQNHPTMKFEQCDPNAEHAFIGDYTLLMPQYEWRSYRIDWVIKVTFLNQPYFFIECDGQEYHSSEQQIRHDQRKDEILRDAGIQIFRFSGRDLNRNAAACVKYVFEAMKAQYELEWSAGFHRAQPQT